MYCSKVLVFPLFISLLFITCKSDKKTDDNTPPPDDNIQWDEAPAEAEAQLANARYFPIDLNDIILPNEDRLMDFMIDAQYNYLNGHKNWLPYPYSQGVRQAGNNPTGRIFSAQAARNALIGRMQVYANYLISDEHFHGLTDNKPVPPVQNGLAYIFNGKDFTTLQKSSNGGTCTEMLYGLDGSGMLANIMTHSVDGIQVSDSAILHSTAATLSLAATWEKLIQDAIPSNRDFNRIKVIRFSSNEIKLNEILTGDIVFFYSNDKKSNPYVSHIGLATRAENGKLGLCQSNGLRNGQCELNYSADRGPRRIEINEPWEQYKFVDYGVIRLYASIAGSWIFYLRCSASIHDYGEVLMGIPSSSDDGPFTAEGEGSDSTGRLIYARIKGFYDKKTNILSGEFSFSHADDSTDIRIDSFTLKVKHDDDQGSYVEMTKVLDNHGCPLVVKMIDVN